MWFKLFLNRRCEVKAMVVITQSSNENQSKFSSIDRKMLEDKEDELGTENLVKVYVCYRVFHWLCEARYSVCTHQSSSLISRSCPLKQVKFSKGIHQLRDAIAILSMRLIGSDEREIADDLHALEICELCFMIATHKGILIHTSFHTVDYNSAQSPSRFY